MQRSPSVLLTGYSTLLLLGFNHFHIVLILRVQADKIVLLLN